MKVTLVFIGVFLIVASLVLCGVSSADVDIRIKDKVDCYATTDGITWEKLKDGDLDLYNKGDDDED